MCIHSAKQQQQNGRSGNKHKDGEQNSGKGVKKGAENHVKKVDVNVLRAKRPAHILASAMALLGDLESGMHVCIYVCLHVCMYVCMCVRVSICAGISSCMNSTMYPCVNVYRAKRPAHILASAMAPLGDLKSGMYLCIYLCMYVCMCACPLVQV